MVGPLKFQEINGLEDRKLSQTNAGFGLSWPLPEMCHFVLKDIQMTLGLLTICRGPVSVKQNTSGTVKF